MNSFPKIFDSSSTVNDKDYFNKADGLWYCGKCHTPKERITENIGKHPVKCKCELDAIKQEEIELAESKRLKAIEEKRRKCFESDYDTYRYFTFDNADNKDTKVFKLCKRYADRFGDMLDNKLDKNGLVLCGNFGTGKTYMSICIANAVIDSEYSCLVTDFTSIYNGWYASQDKQEYIERFKRYALLIIDDFAVQRDTATMIELIYSIINERYKVKRPIIITTNLNPGELNNPKDQVKRRYYDRICELCYLFEVKGENRRKQKDLEKNYKMKEFYEN